MLFHLRVGTEDQHWLFYIKVLFASFSFQVDWDDYPGVTLAFSLWKYQIGVNALKNEYQPSLQN